MRRGSRWKQRQVWSSAELVSYGTPLKVALLDPHLSVWNLFSTSDLSPGGALSCRPSPGTIWLFNPPIQPLNTTMTHTLWLTVGHWPFAPSNVNVKCCITTQNRFSPPQNQRIDGVKGQTLSESVVWIDHGFELKTFQFQDTHSTTRPLSWILYSSRSRSESSPELKKTQAHVRMRISVLTHISSGPVHISVNATEPKEEENQKREAVVCLVCWEENYSHCVNLKKQEPWKSLEMSAGAGAFSEMIIRGRAEHVGIFLKPFFIGLVSDKNTCIFRQFGWFESLVLSDDQRVKRTNIYQPFLPVPGDSQGPPIQKHTVLLAWWVFVSLKAAEALASWEAATAALRLSTCIVSSPPLSGPLDQCARRRRNRKVKNKF